MPSQPPSRAGLRNVLALLALMAAVATFTAVSFASAPSGILTHAEVGGGGTPSPTPTGCIQVWNVVDSPSPYQFSELLGVDALSSTSAWAVGTNLIEEWDGNAWTALTDTLPITYTTQLWGVSAVSANDVWAVGRGDGPGHSEGVIIHWDGSNWGHLPNPDPDDETGLYAVEAISSNDAWAVGYQYEYNSSHALAMHWDGSIWSIVPTPTPPSGAYQLRSLSAVSTNDVWTVGWQSTGALIMHWDGSAWTISPSPFSAQLAGVVAITHNDVWASGATWNGSGYDASIFHWDGTAWTLSTTQPGKVLFRMAATSSQDVWAVGRGYGTLVMHWDGNAWSVVNSPAPFPYAGELYDVAAISPTEVWAVGDAEFGSGGTTLTIRYDRWCPMPIVCATGWNVVDVSNPSPDVNFIRGIDALSANDVWAVGAFALLQGGTYTQHWNGSYWSPVLVPGLPAVTVLYDVKALSANDVWAVGWADPNTRDTDFNSLLPGRHNRGASQKSPSDNYQTVIVHWDGQTWTRVPSPNPGTMPDGTHLYGIDGVSANDLWAVGYYRDSNGFETLILHWNGSAWTQVTSPAGVLSDVDAIAANDIWAVGYNAPYSTNSTLILHWDGALWAVVPSPSPSANENNLYGVSAVSATDIWAVGSRTGSSSYVPLTLHWDGTQWNVVDAPGNAELYGVSARAANDVWAVGPGGSAQSTIMHWDGSVWTEASHPGPGPNQLSELYGVLAVSSNEVWAVGDIGHYYISTRIERWVGSCQTVTPTPSTTVTPTSCVPAWSVVPSPNQGSSDDLHQVAAVSANDVWAVGFSNDNVNGTTQTLVEHWNGTAWSIVPSPNQGSYSYLWSVAALSTNDLWAVGGYHLNGNGTNQTLVEHWDGITWSLVPSPNQGSGGNFLNAVAMVSANDVWAVGNAASQTLVEHWNGSIWSIVPSPNAGSTNYLYGVAAISANDVWAAGFADNSQTLVEHWNGIAWSIVPSPNPGASANYLDAVAAVSANDVWAVGYDENAGVSQTLIEHWNGTAWSVISSPNPGASLNQLYAVSADSANNVWAVGFYKNSSPDKTLVEHWDGTAWSVISSPNEGPSDNLLFGIAAISANDVWAVGDYSDDSSTDRTLTEHYGGCNPTPTATRINTTSPSPTNTTIMPTNTGTRTSTTTTSATRTFTPASTITPGGLTPTSTFPATATTTATSCPIQFSDVPQGSTFYTFIRCLACRGIINGYTDGTFRPNNNVTRGQLSKIVSNSAGFSDPQTTQMFQDVSLGSTFQVFIGRLASRGYIDGYPCGGPGEECVPPRNLPYFRPYNNATRGQIAKIVANAAGFVDPPTGQSFEDVPPGSTFYTFTERLAERSVMQGYPCGAFGEPCSPPANRPYFRPFNNATRGQTSKIVSNTFFPGCAP